MPYDLSERTKLFSSNLIRVLKDIKLTLYNRNIIEQLLRSGTSIGANYQEANGSVSKKDFKTKIALCKKESLESRYWLSLLIDLSSENKSPLSLLQKESSELVLIFSKILKTINNSLN